MAEREKRTARFELRLTEVEADRIRERAEASGLSAAAYIRRAALSSGEPVLVADVRELRPLYAELRRCGSNVNQIARALNTYGADGAGDAAVAASLVALERACNAVADAMEATRP